MITELIKMIHICQNQKKMDNYKPILFQTSHGNQYQLHVFVPIPDENHTLELQPTILDNGVRVFTYNIVANTSNQTLNDLHLIDKHPTRQHEDYEGCTGVRVVVNPPNGGQSKQTPRQYSDPTILSK
jgi:hypothetical protein